MSFKVEESAKIRTFIKTYLYFHPNGATARELASAMNTIDIGLQWGVTSTEITRLLMKEMNKSFSVNHFLSDVRYRQVGLYRIYFLEKEGDIE